LVAAILKTLVYADLFDYPLNRREVWQRLIAPSPVDSPILAQTLKFLVAKRRIGRWHGWFFLPGRAKICQTRLKRARISQSKWLQVLPLVKRLGKLPWVRLIAITGALAVDNAEQGDDIDLLVVTTPQRLWLSRLYLVGLTEILGIRRRPSQTQVADKVCLNMFLETTTLLVPARKQSLYTAYEVLQVKPVVNKQQTYERFLHVNGRWVRRFLPHLPSSPGEFPQEEPLSKSRLMNLGESASFWLQQRYMKRRQTRELVTRQVAFFHPRNRAKEILSAFSRNYRRFIASKRV
jgi:hypothetical protein